MRWLWLASCALVRRQAEPNRFCAPDALKDFCAVFHAHGLQALLTLSNEETKQFHAAAGLPWPASYSCELLCEKTLSYARELGVRLPPSPRVACADASCREVMSLDDATVAAEAGQELAEALRGAEPDDHDGDHDGDVVVLRADDAEEPEDLALPTVSFTPKELAKQLLVLMGIFPAELGEEQALLEVTATGTDEPEFGPMVTAERQAKYRKFVAHGAALLSAAIRRLEYNPSKVKRWLGEEVVMLEMFDLKMTLQKMLKAILNLKIQVGQTCRTPWVMAYVTTWRSRQNYFIKSEKDWNGNYVVNMCPHFWEKLCWACPDENNRVSYGVLIHEVAHHTGASDIKLEYSGQTAYGVENNIALVRQQGSYGNMQPDQGAMNNADNLMAAVLDLASDLTGEAPLPPPPAPSPNGWLKSGTCSTPCGATEYDPAGAKGTLDIENAFIEGGAQTLDTERPRERRAKSEGPLPIPAEHALKEDECARCRWAFRERWTFGQGGCHDGFSLGHKKFFKKICCHKEKCFKEADAIYGETSAPRR